MCDQSGTECSEVHVYLTLTSHLNLKQKQTNHWHVAPPTLIMQWSLTGWKVSAYQYFCFAWQTFGFYFRPAYMYGTKLFCAERIVLQRERILFHTCNQSPTRKQLNNLQLSTAQRQGPWSVTVRRRYNDTYRYKFTRCWKAEYRETTVITVTAYHITEKFNFFITTHNTNQHHLCLIGCFHG